MCLQRPRTRGASVASLRREATEGMAELVALIGANGVISVHFQVEINRKRVTSRTDRSSRDHLSKTAADV